MNRRFVAQLAAGVPMLLGGVALILLRDALLSTGGGVLQFYGILIAAGMMLVLGASHVAFAVEAALRPPPFLLSWRENVIHAVIGEDDR